MIHFDTSFVVDFLRESSREESGPASNLLVTLGEEEVSISVFVVCELLAGVGLARRGEEERRKVEAFCSALRTSYPDRHFAEVYGRLASAVRRAGHNISAMDALIAAAALREEARLVTRNRRDFAPVPGLALISY